MKLTVNMLDNLTESAVINVGEDNGYLEAYVDGAELVLNVYNQSGDLLYNDAFSLREMQG